MAVRYVVFQSGISDIFDREGTEILRSDKASVLGDEIEVPTFRCAAKLKHFRGDYKRVLA